MTTCPAGSYCPVNSNKPTPCPQGTFSASTGLQAVGDCTACTAGKYWSGTGLTAVTGNCMAGYYWKSYAFSQMPSTDSSTAIEADQRYGPWNSGSYCPAATGTPILCIAGTYNDAIMGAASTDCKACLPGKYWAGTGNKAPTGDCQAGYYCPGGDTTATPTTAWAAGEYWPTGSSLNTRCPAGTFSSAAQASSWTACTAGKYWTIGTSTPTDCPAGYYCPLNTQYSTQYRGTPVFLSGLANLKQNPGENHGMGSIPLKSTDFQTSPNKFWTVYWTVLRSRLEFSDSNSTVRSYLYPVNRKSTDDPIYGGGNGPRWG